MTTFSEGKRVAIVLVNWNTAPTTVECVKSLRQLTHRSWQIVVVDNSSCKSDYDVLRTSLSKETILRQKQNLGFAGGCNVGIRWALSNGFEYVWLVNTDVVVDARSLSELVGTSESDPRIGIAGGVLYYWDEPKRIQIAGGSIDPATGRGEMLRRDELDEGQFSGDYDVDYVSGGMLLAKAEAIRDVGLLDERFFMYYEDTDWAVRMRTRGWRVITNSAAKAWHKDKGTAGAAKPYLLQHGYFMFLFKNFRRNLPHALRLYARHYMRPHMERREWPLVWQDARVYLRFISRLALVRANLHP